MAALFSPVPPPRCEPHAVLVVMGVAGSGKSTVATALAAGLRLPFLEGDDHHPDSNVRKMSRGLPLTDEDRWPWLTSLGEAMKVSVQERGGVVAACSALKRIYRRHLAAHVGEPITYVFLDVSREGLIQRLRARHDHFMPESLLESQLATLERPTPDEAAVIVDGERPIEEITDDVMARVARRAP